jgi:hypothetical protein
MINEYMLLTGAAGGEAGYRDAAPGTYDSPLAMQIGNMPAAPPGAQFRGTLLSERAPGLKALRGDFDAVRHAEDRPRAALTASLN